MKLNEKSSMSVEQISIISMPEQAHQNTQLEQLLVSPSKIAQCFDSIHVTKDVIRDAPESTLTGK